MKIPKNKWIWMPHPAHFICAKDCKYHLATKIGKYIVSTVGEYLPDFRVRQIFAKSRGIKINGIGDSYDYDYLQKIGYEDLHFGGWKYETMVFLATTSKIDCGCPYHIANGHDLDATIYKTANEAYKGHLKLCNKWSNTSLKINPN